MTRPTVRLLACAAAAAAVAAGALAVGPAGPAAAHSESKTTARNCPVGGGAGYAYVRDVETFSTSHASMTFAPGSVWLENHTSRYLYTSANFWLDGVLHKQQRKDNIPPGQGRDYTSIAPGLDGWYHYSRAPRLTVTISATGGWATFVDDLTYFGGSSCNYGTSSSALAAVVNGEAELTAAEHDAVLAALEADPFQRADGGRAAGDRATLAGPVSPLGH